MRNFLVFLATQEPTPGDELREGLDVDAVTPGTLGFLATLFIVVVSFFLIRDMVKRVRRVRYREQVQERLEQEEAAAKGAPTDRAVTRDGAGHDGGAPHGGHDGAAPRSGTSAADSAHDSTDDDRRT